MPESGPSSTAPGRGLTWDPTNPDVRANPYPLYHRLLEEAPLLQSEFGFYLVSRYEDCLAVLKHPGASTDYRKHPGWSPPDGYDPEVLPSAFLFIDPPDHTRIRGLVSRAFTPTRVEQLRARTESIVASLLDKAAADGGMEVVSDLAFPLPVTVICEMLGVPSQDVGLFKQWSAARARSLDPEFTLPPEAVEKAREALRDGREYFRLLISERRRSPQPDLLSAMVQAEEHGAHLSEAEVNANVRLLLDAGHETTVNLLANGVLNFARHPEQFQLLRDNPALVKGAVEEVLRYDPPVHVNGRLMLEPAELSTGTLPRYADVVLLVAAANHDAAQFVRPGTFDITRPNNRHLGFGFGIHHCVGAPLARLEAQVVFAALAQRFKRVRLLEDPPPYKENITLRGVARLAVAFEA